MREKLKNISNKKIVIITLCVMIVILILGFTYAYWTRTFTQTGINENLYECFEIEFEENVEGVSQLQGYPQTDEEGLKTPAYEVTIKNTCNTAASYNVVLHKLNTSSLDDSHLKVAVDGDTRLLSETETTETTIENATEARIINTGIIAGKDSKTIKVRSWMEENTSEEEGQNKSFSYKITIEATATRSDLAGIILASNKLQTAIPDFSKTAVSQYYYDNYPSENIKQERLTAETGLYKTEDDDGDTYYFRGGVENNYVKFANYYWRIIRINGDQSIRLIYDGTSAHENGEAAEDRHIGKSAFAEQAGEEEYVGYTYPTRTGYKNLEEKSEAYEMTFSSNYYYADDITFNEETGEYSLVEPLHQMSECIENKSLCEGKYTTRSSSLITRKYILQINSIKSDTNMEVYAYKYKGTPVFEEGSSNDSIIKQYIDNWYNTNLSAYDNKISESIFCNDTSYIIVPPTSTSKIGKIEFGSYTRNQANTPTLKCPQTNAAYGGKYNLKVGLISEDEANYAGLSGSAYGSSLGYSKDLLRGAQYLLTGDSFWTLSPRNIGGTIYNVFSFNYVGGIDGGEISSSNYNTVRPVINLKSDVKVISGDGSKDNPYVIE